MIIETGNPPKMLDIYGSGIEKDVYWKYGDRMRGRTSDQGFPLEGGEIVCIADLDDNIISANPFTFRLLRHSSHPRKIEGLMELIHQESSLDFEDRVRQVLSGELDSDTIKVPMHLPEGDIYYLLTLSPVNDREEITGVAVTGHPEGEAVPIPKGQPVPLSADLLASLNIMLVYVNPSGAIVHVNRAFENLLGYTLDEIRGRQLGTLTTMDATAMQRMRDAGRDMRPGEVLSVDVDLRTSEGKIIHSQWRAMSVRDEYGGLMGVIALAQDPNAARVLEVQVSELSSQIETLSVSAAEMESALDPDEVMEQMISRMMAAIHMQLAVIRMADDPGQQQVFYKGLDFQEARNILDVEVEDLILSDWIDARGIYICPDRELDPFFSKIYGMPRSFILASIGLRGFPLGLALFGSPAKDKDLERKAPVLQTFLHQIAMRKRDEITHEDVTHRNVELQTLYETSKMLSSTIEHKIVLELILEKSMELVRSDNCLIFELDKKGRRLRCVASKTKDGVSAEGLEIAIGEGISGLVAQHREGMLIERADMDGRSILLDGTPDEPSSIISVPLNIGDEIFGVMTLEKTPGVPFNTSEYRLVEMFSIQAAFALKNAGMYKSMEDNMAMQQMYNVLLTHDVANYNVPIHGFLELLVKDPKLDDRQRRYVRSALVQAENISSLIASVRKLWWLRTTDQELDLGPINLAPFVRECIDSLRMSSLFNAIEIKGRYESEQAFVVADVFVKDILYNLISNACKYGDMRPVEVELYAWEENGKDYWRLDVKDQGKGIPDERKSALFKRFDRLDSVTAAEGHGLGLSVVKAFCDRYSGRVWAENRVPGDWSKGSVFCVILPRTRNQPS